MLLQLNPNSGVPIYRQVVQLLRARIASGQLATHEQLPSARDLSLDLKVNPLTINKVYQILEREGLVEVRRGLGTFVASAPKPWSLAEKRRLMAPAVQQVVAEARHLRMSETELQKLVHEHFREASRDESFSR